MCIPTNLKASSRIIAGITPSGTMENILEKIWQIAAEDIIQGTKYATLRTFVNLRILLNRIASPNPINICIVVLPAINCDPERTVTEHIYIIIDSIKCHVSDTTVVIKAKCQGIDDGNNDNKNIHYQCRS